MVDENTLYSLKPSFVHIYLVHNHDDAVLVAQFPYAAQKAQRRRQEAAFPCRATSRILEIWTLQDARRRRSPAAASGSRLLTIHDPP